MKIQFISNEGGGFADFVEVESGATAGKFFADRHPDADPNDYLVRVNREPVAADQILHSGDRVTVTPRKIEGATA